MHLRLSGLAGTGKSTIARTVARKYYEQKRLGASFFFSRGSGDVGHAGKFVTSIAVQLANDVPSLQRYICEAITERSDIKDRSLSDQWRQLILSPLLESGNNSRRSSYVLVVDALDECDDVNNIRAFDLHPRAVPAAVHFHFLLDWGQTQGLPYGRFRLWVSSPGPRS